VPAIASPTTEVADPPAAGGGWRGWGGLSSLTGRILALNILVLALLAGGFFYLDSYRARLVDSRTEQVGREVGLIAIALQGVRPTRRDPLILRLAGDTDSRLRVYDRYGLPDVDSQELGLRNMRLRDPDRDGWDQRFARTVDAAVDRIAGAPRTPLYRERANGLAWPDVREAADTGTIATTAWRAPDRTPVLTAAARMRDGSTVLLATNAADITQSVRAERFRLALVLAVATGVAVSLSLVLAGTIVAPLRRLARAAVQVRLGRAREVVVPRLPSRRDELGQLARAVSDMASALRLRIDATEAFAADVTHELKNPLASLRSAVDGLATVRDPALAEQLMAVVRDDVLRLDRLITDISEASRLDAQLSRATFEDLDVAALLQGLLDQRAQRGVPNGVRIAFDGPMAGTLPVLAEGARLERVFENLLDNAVSFSPPGGLVRLGTRCDDGRVAVWVEDEGPGVPPDQRDAVFRRFQSVRPSSEAFGQHSGLGLAIARTIVEGHGGTIAAEDRPDGADGARFVVDLPLAPATRS